MCVCGERGEGEWGGVTVTCVVNTLPVLQSRAELVHREMLRCIDCSLSLCRRRGVGRLREEVVERGGQCATCEPIKCQWIQIV